MKSNNPKCILFAGPGGCSKTPVSYYLSWNLNLPIFNNDTIRTEVCEETLKYNPEDKEYLRRRDARLKKLVNSHLSFICDASIDREWAKIIPLLEANDYHYFIISYDLKTPFLSKMGRAKGYEGYDHFIRIWQKDHKNFLNNSGLTPNLIINNANFSKRLETSLKAVRKFLIS